MKHNSTYIALFHIETVYKSIIPLLYKHSLHFE